MHFNHILAVLGLVAGVTCQYRTTTIFKKLSPSLAPVAAPVAAPMAAAPDVYDSPLGFPAVDSRRPPQSRDAMTISNNPTSIVYRAQLSGQYGLQSTVTAQAGPGGVGVRYRIEAKGLFGYGPFSYAIYEKSVPVNGDCYNLGGKLDPYQRGESPKCQFGGPETCQVGDLSGKYGKLDPVPTARKQFVDRFSSLKESDAAFIGGRSVAIVDNTGARLACSNLVEAEDVEYEDLSV